MEEGSVKDKQMFVTDQYAAELTSLALVRSIFRRRL